MRKQSTLSVAATVVVSTGIALAQDQSQTAQQLDKTGAGVQSTKRDKLPVVTLLDASASLAGCGHYRPSSIRNEGGPLRVLYAGRGTEKGETLCGLGHL
jgi:hypothetical protein